MQMQMQMQMVESLKFTNGRNLTSLLRVGVVNVVVPPGIYISWARQLWTRGTDPAQYTKYDPLDGIDM